MPCHIGNGVSVCRPSGDWTDWKDLSPTDEDGGETTLTDCCVCRVPRTDVQYRVFIDRSGWYEPYGEFRCKPGTGCDINPRKRIGADNRRGWED